MKSIRSILLLAMALLARLAFTFRERDLRGRGLVLLANTYDAAVETHAYAVNRTNDAAITTRHLLWKKGSADGGVALAGTDAPALGTIDNVESSTGLNQSVLLLGKGSTKKMVSAAAIAAGVEVYQAASGKVTSTPGTYKVGVSLTAAGDADEIIEVADCVSTDISGT